MSPEMILETMWVSCRIYLSALQVSFNRHPSMRSWNCFAGVPFSSPDQPKKGARGFAAEDHEGFLISADI